MSIGLLRALACAAVFAAGTAGTHAAPPRTLPRSVEAALAAAKVPPAAMAATVQEIGARRPLLAWNVDRPLNPASLMKVATTAAALDLLGPAWTWRTPVWLDGRVHDGVLDGSLVIKGSGDPKLVVERLWLALRRVQQMGVREIRGDIVLDRSAFAVPDEDPAAFDGEAQRPYNVQPDALLLNYRALTLAFTPDLAAGVARVSADAPLAGLRVDATVPLAAGPCGDWRVALKADTTQPQRLTFAGGYPQTCGEQAWPLAPAAPQSYNERLLRGLWQELGGTLTGRVRDGAAPAAPPAFELRSPPLAEIVRDINKHSNNVMAQQLFLTLALAQRGQGTPQGARELLGQWLAERYGDTGRTAVVDNGSGLSRDNRLSAALLLQLLQSIYAGPAMPEFAASLPITGLDGTMRRATVAVGRAHLKTGSLRDVAGVAGDVLAASGKRYLVVALVNHPDAAAARPAIDALLKWVAEDAPEAHGGAPR